MLVQNIGDSFVCFNDECDVHIREYYLYCVSIVKKWIIKNELKTNVIIGNYTVEFHNELKTFKIDIQCEHTLVKEGGRSVENKIFGQTKHEDGNYLIRIDKFDYLNSLDCIIEYSLPNIFNISSNPTFEEYLNKNVYISPILYDVDFSNVEKNDVVTLFSVLENDRRQNFLTNLNDLKVPNINIDSLFSNDSLLDLYKKTKILINIHQTEHHHTFEELRVLPALLNGIIIISEDVPLKENIPYWEYIIWAKYEDVATKTLEVYNNYEKYYKKIFIDGELKQILKKMKKDNLNVFDKYIL